MKRPFFVAAVMSIAAVYLSLYAKLYIVIIVGIMVFTGFLIYLKKTGIPGFYVIFIMMFPIMCLRTEVSMEKLCYQGQLSDKTHIAYVNGYIADIKQSENGYAVYIRNAFVMPDSWGRQFKSGLVYTQKKDLPIQGMKLRLK